MRETILLVIEMSNWFYVSFVLYVLGATLYFQFGQMVFASIMEEGELEGQHLLTDEENEIANFSVNFFMSLFWPLVVFTYLVRRAFGVEIRG
jgi:hypothetical protein